MDCALLAKSINNAPLTADKSPPTIIKRTIRRHTTQGKINPLPKSEQATIARRTHGGKIPRARCGVVVFHTGRKIGRGNGIVNGFFSIGFKWGKGENANWNYYK